MNPGDLPTSSLDHLALIAPMIAVFRQHGDHQQRAYIQSIDPTDPAVFRAIACLCTDDHPPSIQRWAIEALGVFQPERALPLLRGALKSPHMSVRLHAMLGLGALGERRLARYIRPLLDDPSGGIRVNALALVADLQPRWLNAVAKAALQDEKRYVRQLAAKILGGNGRMDR